MTIENKKGKFAHLLYRNQFILGPDVNGFESWRGFDLSGGLQLRIHPELNFNLARLDGKLILLLGYILDPGNPDASDSDILTALLRKSGSCAEIIRNTFGYGGRWVIIFDDGRDRILFHDAAGLRQVFYAKMDSGIWCASQPGTISGILDLKMDPAAAEFINSEEFKKDKENRWPAESTAYKEIRHLLPNHWLDLKTGVRKRYWPDGPLGVLSMNEGLQRAADRLRGLMKSAAQRFEIALSMTAGLDSRLVLAASRQIKNRLEFVTVNQVRMGAAHPDVIVPRRLLAKLGLPHTTIESGFQVEDGFLKTFHSSVDFAHRLYAYDAYAIYKYGGQRKVAVTGSVSEIARCSYRLEGQISSETLARLQRMGRNKFALNNFDEWLSGLGNIYNLHPLDLFEWEQGHGNWLAMCQQEFDSAWKDIFTPFNCRALLLDMLSVPEKFRSPVPGRFYKRLISRLWPEVLIQPINPHLKRPFYSLVTPQVKRLIRNFVLVSR